MKRKICIGRTEDGTPVYINLRDFRKCVLVCGQTGMGKTDLRHLRLHAIKHELKLSMSKILPKEGRS